MRLAYNTNGFPHHRVAQIVEVLAGLGYDGIAITPDVFQLPPFGAGVDEARQLRRQLDDLSLAVAVETGARFVLDPERKHQPTLLSSTAGAARRLDLLKRCHELAVILGAETLSFWSGAWGAEADEPAPPSTDALLDRLCAGASALLDHAASSGVTICFEPEPGMAVASLVQLHAFLQRLGRDELRVMLDVGHVPVTETASPAEVLTALAPRLGGLQLDDSRGGVHEHLLPGDGVLDFGALAAAARSARFTGLASVELPRHGHDPVATAGQALQRLRGWGWGGSAAR